MAAVVVVGVEERFEDFGAVGVVGVGPQVGPLVQQGAVEAPGLSVRLWPVGAGAFVSDACGLERLVPDAGAVTGAVVGQYALDGDAEVGEERLCPAPESGGGLLAFVGEDLAVGQAGVVVDGGVDEAVADLRGTAGGSFGGGGVPVGLAGL